MKIGIYDPNTEVEINKIISIERRDDLSDTIVKICAKSYMNKRPSKKNEGFAVKY